MTSVFSRLRSAFAPEPKRAASLALRAVVRSTAGPVRTTNEDRARCVLEDAPDHSDPRVALVLLADGMGGHQAGEVAAETTIEVVAQAWRARSGRAPRRVLEKAITHANADVFAASRTRRDWEGMGTTITALAFDGDTAYVGHVGDTRAYLYRQGALRRLTEDDSLVNHLLRTGAIGAAQRDNHPDHGILTQALGTHERLRTIHLDGPFAVQAGDVFVLCTDGLHDVLDDRAIERVLAEVAPLKVPDVLIERAVAAATQDNISVAVVMAGAPDAAAAAAPRATRIHSVPT